MPMLQMQSEFLERSSSKKGDCSPATQFTTARSHDSTWWYICHPKAEGPKRNPVEIEQYNLAAMWLAMYTSDLYLALDRLRG